MCVYVCVCVCVAVWYAHPRQPHSRQQLALTRNTVVPSPPPFAEPLGALRVLSGTVQSPTRGASLLEPLLRFLGLICRQRFEYIVAHCGWCSVVARSSAVVLSGAPLSPRPSAGTTCSGPDIVKQQPQPQAQPLAAVPHIALPVVASTIQPAGPVAPQQQQQRRQPQPPRTPAAVSAPLTQASVVPQSAKSLASVSAGVGTAHKTARPIAAKATAAVITAAAGTAGHGSDSKTFITSGGGSAPPPPLPTARQQDRVAAAAALTTAASDMNTGVACCCRAATHTLCAVAACRCELTTGADSAA